MTFKHGRLAEVWLNGADLSEYFRSMEFNADVDTAETTTFKKLAKTHIVGTYGAVADLEGLYDPGIMPTFEALLGAATGSVLTLMPAGAVAIGDLARLISVDTTAYGQSSQVGDAVLFKWSVLADGVVGFGQVLHILTEDTNTTTGATKTDAASTSTGWTAHLHVTVVDGGSWVVTIEDASASNFSDGALVSGATFTAATSATSQRLAGAAGATLRRYVRYVATRTGGSAGDGITFGLAYSRN